MPRFCNPLLSNRTGESVLLNTARRLCGLSLRRAQEQSGFNDSIGRMPCDHKPMIRRSRLDFVETARFAIERVKCRLTVSIEAGCFRKADSSEKFATNSNQH